MAAILFSGLQKFNDPTLSLLGLMHSFILQYSHLMLCSKSIWLLNIVAHLVSTLKHNEILSIQQKPIQIKQAKKCENSCIIL